MGFDTRIIGSMREIQFMTEYMSEYTHISRKGLDSLAMVLSMLFPLSYNYFIIQLALLLTQINSG